MFAKMSLPLACHVALNMQSRKRDIFELTAKTVGTLDVRAAESVEELLFQLAWLIVISHQQAAKLGCQHDANRKIRFFPEDDWDDFADITAHPLLRTDNRSV